MNIEDEFELLCRRVAELERRLGNVIRTPAVMPSIPRHPVGIPMGPYWPVLPPTTAGPCVCRTTSTTEQAT